jgi:hypothetical protein
MGNQKETFLLKEGDNYFLRNQENLKKIRMSLD